MGLVKSFVSPGAFASLGTRIVPGGSDGIPKGGPLVRLVLESQITLTCEYDAEDDTLYAWVGDGPQPAITFETDEGHLIRLDPETKEFIGVTIFDFQERWSTEPIQVALSDG